MTSLAFQTGMAHLIRFPDLSWTDVEAKLNVPFSFEERVRLQAMANDPLVRKFGFKMRFLRQRDATEVMQTSKNYIGSKLLETLYVDLFEPERKSSALPFLGIYFLEFCLNDSRCQRLLEKENPFLRDMILYDYARAYVSRQIPADTPLPAGSLLAHNSFKIINLTYDIPSIHRLLVKNPDLRPLPGPVSMKLIFVRANKYPYYRMFTIDDTIERFLVGQRDSPEAYNEEKPQVYQNLKDIGLCI